MGKANDKKVVRDTRDLLVVAFGNLLQSERERKFTYKTKPGPKRRKTFCNKFGFKQATIAGIETGRMLRLKFARMRSYLAAVRGKDDKRLLVSLQKVYDGLKELDKVLKRL